MTSMRTEKNVSAPGSYKTLALLGFTTIGLAFGVCGTWAAYAPLDSAAIATGKVAVESNRKPIQHLEGGILSEVLVRETQVVRKGDVLFQLDETQSRAKATMLSQQIDQSLAKLARLTAERDGLQQIVWPSELRGPARSSIQTREQRLFDERKLTLESQIEILKSRIAQSQEQIVGRRKQAEAFRAQAESVAGDVARYRKLRKKKLIRLSKLKEAERHKVKFESDAARARADMALAKERISEAKLQIIQMKQQFREQAVTQLSETESKIADLSQQLLVANDELSRHEIRAPQSGVIQSIMVHAKGAVIRPGETIAEIIPISDDLVVTAQVSPADIDSVVADQRAEIRFPALSSRGLKSMYGRVETISADTMIDEVTGQPYYRAKIIVNQADIPENVARKLIPGMPSEVVIVTGERTALNYLISPLTDMLATGMREQ